MLNRKFDKGRRRLHTIQFLNKVERGVAVRVSKLHELIIVVLHAFNSVGAVVFDEIGCLGSGGACILISLL